MAKIHARPIAVVIRLTALGDVLLTASTLQQLGQSHHVILVTEPAYASLASKLPGVAEVRPLSRRDGIRGAIRLGLQLRALGPSLVLDFQSKARSEALAKFTGAPVRTLRRRTWPQALKALAGRDTILDTEHQTQRYETLLSARVPKEASLRLDLDSKWVDEASKAAAAADWIDAPAVAVAPAATHATKGWGARKYAQIVKRTVTSGTPLLLVGGPSDASDLTAFREELGEWPRLLDTSTLPLTTLAALLARCEYLAGNDSGPIHLARLLGVPTLGIFGPTSVRRWGPPPDAETTQRALSLGLECSPCSNHGGKQCPLGHHDCMQKLSVDQVVTELVQLTSLRAAPRPSPQRR